MCGLEFPELNAVLADVPDLPELKFDLPNWMSYRASSRWFCRTCSTHWPMRQERIQGVTGRARRPPPCPAPAQRPKGECMNA
jgi:hypothetical protein